MSRMLILSCAVLAGCGSPAPLPPKPIPEPVAITQPTPVCVGKQQCEAMWINAHEQLQMITGMRIQTATDSVLQTFGPARGAQLGGMATKYPIGDDRHEIRVRFVCGGVVLRQDCDGLKASATNLFNVMVPGPIK